MTNPLIARFAGQPALIEPAFAERFESNLHSLMSHPQIKEMLSGENASADFWAGDSWESRFRPYNVVDGVLHIPVKGVMLNNFPYAVGDWATGYEYIGAAFNRGMDDSAVRAIALIIDSPGGIVAGNFDLVDKMYARRGEKPVRAFAHESAYSAAYSIASVADHIAVSRTGGVGSIGVVTSHSDMSGALEQRGIKITFIFAGKHKVDGNPTEPLSADVKDRIQTRIDELYGVFVSTVARNRGMDEQAIRDTEAACFTATQALSNGLADSIGSLDDAVSAYADDLDDQSDNEGEEGMSTPDTSAVNQAAIDEAVAAAVASTKAEATQAAAAAVAADRERQKAITGCAEAEGRSTLASHIALNTSMSLEDAQAMLAAAPKEGAAAPVQGTGVDFSGAMDATGNPNVGASSPENQKPETADGQDVLALIGTLGVRGFKTSN